MISSRLTAILDRAAQLINSKAYAEAESLLRPAVAGPESDVRILQLLGVALHRQGQHDEGLILLKRSCNAARRMIDQCLASSSSDLVPDLLGAVAGLAERERGLGWLMCETGLGRQAEFWFARSVSSQRQYDMLSGLVSGPLESITEPIRLRSDLAVHFGEMATELDVYCKMMELGWIAPRRPIVLTGAGVANSSLLDLWRDRIDLDPAHPDEIAAAGCFESLIPLERDGRRLRVSFAYPFVEQEWAAQGRDPLLRLDPEMRVRGRAFLRKMVGLAESDWFVVLHMRDSTYGESQGLDETQRQHRNQSLDASLAAVDLITARGGWVIRLGDAKAPAIPALPRLFDYARCADREEWLDVYLCADAAFYWGTSSGPISLAWAFGKPIAASNWIPLASPPPQSQTIFTAKQIWLSKVDRWASLSEMLAEPFYSADYSTIYAEAGAIPVENGVREIRGLIKQRLTSLNTTLNETPRQRAARAVYQAAGLVLNARLSDADLTPI